MYLDGHWYTSCCSDIEIEIFVHTYYKWQIFSCLDKFPVYIFVFPVRIKWHICGVGTHIMYSLMPPSYVSTLPLISPLLPWYWTLKCCCNLTDEIMCCGCSTYRSKTFCNVVVDKLLALIEFQLINKYILWLECPSICLWHFHVYITYVTQWWNW